MSFKGIAEIIKKYTGENSESGDKSQKSEDSRAFELFLQDKQSVEVAIELELSADEVEDYAKFITNEGCKVIEPNLYVKNGSHTLGPTLKWVQKTKYLHKMKSATSLLNL